LTIRRLSSLLLNAYVVGRAYLGLGYEMLITPLLTLLAFLFALLHGSESMGAKRTTLLLVLIFSISLAFESIV
jgi:hypothetical protein